METVTFRAIYDVTKTTLDGKNVKWCSSDEIAVIGTDGAVAKFTTSADKISSDGLSADFTGEIASSEKYFAVFPYSDKVSLSGSSVTTLVPFSEKAETAGSFSSTSNLAVAVSENNSFCFRNVMSFLKVNVSEDNVTEILVRSNDAQASLAGLATIAVDEDGVPSVSSVDGVPFISLVPADGQSTIAQGTYYMPVLPCNMNSGISLRVKKGEKMYVKEGTSALVAARNTPVNLGSLSTASYKVYTERVITSDAGGLVINGTTCYREFGTSSIALNGIDGVAHYLYSLGDYDTSTYWNMPSGNVKTDKAYDINGNETIRGSYLRIEFGPSGNILISPRTVIFEYSIIDAPQESFCYGQDWAPWTLDIRDYSVGSLGQYKSILSLKVEEDALPWTNAYNNRYVSSVVERPAGSTVSYFKRIIFCCTRTRRNDDHTLQPKDATGGVTFCNLAKQTPDSRWGLSELHIWTED